MEGRDDGILRCGGLSIHPHVVRTVLASAVAMTDYQVRQTHLGRVCLAEGRFVGGVASAYRESRTSQAVKE